MIFICYFKLYPCLILFKIIKANISTHNYSSSISSWIRSHFFIPWASNKIKVVFFSLSLNLISIAKAFLLNFMVNVQTTKAHKYKSNKEYNYSKSSLSLQSFLLFIIKFLLSSFCLLVLFNNRFSFLWCLSHSWIYRHNYWLNRNYSWCWFFWLNFFFFIIFGNIPICYLKFNRFISII